jgi:hypothetical protein
MKDEKPVKKPAKPPVKMTAAERELLRAKEIIERWVVE